MSMPVTPEESRRFERELMRGLERRLVARIAAKSSDKGTELLELDPGVYTDPDRLAAEKREIFRNLPQLAGFSSEIPHPGDMLLFDAAGPSILVVRKRDGSVGAYLNMCGHRGAKLVTECKRQTRMACRFHGWTYDLDGRLAGMPAANDFEGIDKEARRLVRVPVGEAHGLIFVKAHAGEEAIDVDAHLGGLAPELAHLDLAGARFVKGCRIEVDANWKYALDTYFEAYHFATLHVGTVGQITVPNTIVTDQFEPGHHRIFFARRYYTDYVGVDESQWPEKRYQGICFIFPNIVINTSPMPEEDGERFFDVHRLFPGDEPGECFVLHETYRPRDSDPKADEARWIAVNDWTENVLINEDYSVSKDGQANMEFAPPGFRPVLGRNEYLVQRYHKRIGALIGMPVDASARGVRTAAE